MNTGERVKRKSCYSFVLETANLQNNGKNLEKAKTPGLGHDHSNYLSPERGMIKENMSFKRQKFSYVTEKHKSQLQPEQDDMKESSFTKHIENKKSHSYKKRRLSRRDPTSSEDRGSDSMSPRVKDVIRVYRKRYYLNKIAGKGVQGSVFIAYDSYQKKKVAVKIMDKDTMDIDENQREINVLKDITDARLDDGFPTLYDYCKKKGTYLVTELLGESLVNIKKKFNVTKGFRMKHVLMIGLQLLRRLKALHSLGYVHGDIKPANVMFGKDQCKNILYLIDFGLTHHESKHESQVIPAAIMKKENLELNGNPLYSSVNQHLGWSKVFRKDDIESFIYFLICISKGSLPWSKVPIIDGDNYYGIYK